MAFKFYNIVKANARIDELDAQLAEKQTELLALASNPAEVEKAFEQTQADLATAKQTIGTLETAAKTSAKEVAALTSELNDVNARLAQVPAQIETAAAAKAVAQTAAQGIPPLAIKVVADPQSPPAKPKGMTAKERLALERNH